MNTLEINLPCPKGGSRLWYDEEGAMHACKLQYYINTAQYYGYDVLKFKDTIINLKKRKAL